MTGGQPARTAVVACKHCLDAAPPSQTIRPRLHPLGYSGIPPKILEKRQTQSWADEVDQQRGTYPFLGAGSAHERPSALIAILT